MEEFMVGIKNAFNEDKCVEGRIKLRKKMWKYVDSKSSERITKKIQELE